jgi:hypothetical protein
MVATTQWNLYDDELETLVTKLNYHARFLTSAAYAIQTKVPDSNGPAHHEHSPKFQELDELHEHPRPQGGK